MKVIITGTTGYVGEGVLHSCLADPSIEKVLSVSRRTTGIVHPKLEEWIVPDFMGIDAGDPHIQGYDAVFFCAGISSVGTPMDKYKVISHDIPLHFAQSIVAKESVCFFYVSGYGTSDKNPQQWAKIKSSTEQELVQMPFKGVFWYRPCFMKPHKDQKFRKSFQISTNILYPFARLTGMANTIEAVAKSMVRLTSEPGLITDHVVGVKEIDKLANQ